MEESEEPEIEIEQEVNDDDSDSIQIRKKLTEYSSGKISSTKESLGKKMAFDEASAKVRQGTKKAIELFHKNGNETY